MPTAIDLQRPHSSRFAAWWAVLRLEYQGDNILCWLTASALATGGRFDPFWLIAGFAMLVLAQASLELLDGYYDHRAGAHGTKSSSDPRWSGGSGVLANGELAPTSVKRVAWLLGTLAVICFAGVTWFRTGRFGLIIGLIGAFAGAGWAMPPFKWSYRGVGEWVQGLVVGPLMAAQAWLVATGSFDARALLVGLPFGALEVAMGLLNNFVDADADRRAGKRTWVVRHGRRAAAHAHAAALLAAGLCHGLLLWRGVYPPQAVVCLLLAPFAAAAAAKPHRAVNSHAQLQTLAATFPTYGVTTLYGLLLLGSSCWARFATEPRRGGWLLAAFVVAYAPVVATLWSRRTA